MKKKVLFGMAVLALVVLLLGVNGISQTLQAQTSRAIDPIVSTQWLESDINAPNLIILDVRTPDEYAKGHVPGAINVPALGNWYLNLFGKEFPWMELPEDKALLATMGKAGITCNSRVVVVGRTADPMGCYAMADAARVAITLVYAGVKNAAILDGGYDKWAADGKKVSTEAVTPTAGTYSGAVLKKMFVSKDYVEKRNKKSALVDARDADVYFGLIQEPWAQKPGHIPGAKCLAVPWFWNVTRDKSGAGTYETWKDVNSATEIASTVLGKNKAREIIVYCGVGGYAGSLWFALHEMLGYTNVKIYDGSIQEWTADPKAPVTKYKCE